MAAAEAAGPVGASAAQRAAGLGFEQRVARAVEVWGGLMAWVEGASGED